MAIFNHSWYHIRTIPQCTANYTISHNFRSDLDSGNIMQIAVQCRPWSIINDTLAGRPRNVLQITRYYIILEVAVWNIWNANIIFFVLECFLTHSFVIPQSGLCWYFCSCICTMISLKVMYMTQTITTASLCVVLYKYLRGINKTKRAEQKWIFTYGKSPTLPRRKTR